MPDLLLSMVAGRSGCTATASRTCWWPWWCPARRGSPHGPSSPPTARRARATSRRCAASDAANKHVLAELTATGKEGRLKARLAPWQHYWLYHLKG